MPTGEGDGGGGGFGEPLQVLKVRGYCQPDTAHAFKSKASGGVRGERVGVPICKVLISVKV